MLIFIHLFKFVDGWLRSSSSVSLSSLSSPCQLFLCSIISPLNLAISYFTLFCQAQVQVQVRLTWAIPYFWFSPIDSCSLHIDSSSTTNFRAVSYCSLNGLQLPHWFIIFTQAPLQFLPYYPLSSNSTLLSSSPSNSTSNSCLQL